MLICHLSSFTKKLWISKTLHSLPLPSGGSHTFWSAWFWFWLTVSIDQALFLLFQWCKACLISNSHINEAPLLVSPFSFNFNPSPPLCYSDFWWTYPHRLILACVNGVVFRHVINFIMEPCVVDLPVLRHPTCLPATVSVTSSVHYLLT